MCVRKVQLLGPVQVQDDVEAVQRFRSLRTMALLGYLVTERRAVARNALAALFYPDEPLAKGRGSLRRDLHNLGQILPDCWAIDRASAHFVPCSGITVDIDSVQQLEKASEWRAAADLLGGDFLEGLALDHNPEFETWLYGERERWRQRSEQVLSKASTLLERQHEYHHALRFAQRLVQQMPWQEEAHRQLIRLLALSGQRSAALKQYEQCKQALADELGVEVSTDTITLYEQVKYRPHFSLNQIPALITPLVGRENELSTLSGMLTDPTIRLLTITGMGGIGKTHLALGVAWQVAAGHFRDGATFVSLAAEDGDEQVVTAIAQALHLPLSAQGTRTARQQLVDYLRTKAALLVLDNCEHLLDGLDIVSSLLDEAPHLSILATSRERLRLHGEHLFALQGLARADERTDHPAAQLFTSAAQRIDPAFTISEKNASHVNRICRMVDGMPLALELAAAWIDTLSIANIADEIEGSLDILAADLRNLPVRHRSMQAVLEAAWRRLKPPLQEVLSALSVLRGTFDLSAARAISEATPPLLAQLVSHSLVHFDVESERYQLHELLRQYSMEQLAQQRDTEDKTRNRHSAYYCQWLRQQEDRLKLGDRHTTLAEIEANVQNIRVAWEWAATQGRIQDLQLAVEGLNRFYDWNALAEEGETVCRRTIAHLGSTETIFRIRLLSQLLAWQGVHAKTMSNFPLSEQLLHQSLVSLDSPLLAHEDVRSEKAFALLFYGGADRESSKSSRLRSLNLYRAAGRKWEAATALEWLGTACQMLGEQGEANEYLQQSLEIRKEIGDQNGIAVSLRALGLSAMDVGDFEGAERLVQNGLTLVRRSNSVRELSKLLQTLSAVQLRSGKFEECIVSVEECFAVHRDHIGSPDQYLPLSCLPEALLHLGNYGRALRLIEPKLVRAESGLDEVRTGHSLLALTMARLAAKEHTQAMELARRCIGIWQENAFQLFLGQALALLGYAASAAGSFPIARRSFLQALEIGTSRSIILPLIYALPGIALLFAVQNEPEKAIEIYALALTQFHVQNSRWFEEVVGRHITVAAQRLPAEVVTAAQIRGKERDLWETAIELSTQLGRNSHYMPPQ